MNDEPFPSEQLTGEQPEREDTVEIPVPGVAPEHKRPASGNWEMPKPVFRKTSGYLPKGFEKLFGRSDGAVSTEESPDINGAGDGHSPGEEIPETAMHPPGENILVEPQPEISDDFFSGLNVPHAAENVQKKKMGYGMVFAGFFILLLILFVVIFMAAIYFLFVLPYESRSIF